MNIANYTSTAGYFMDTTLTPITTSTATCASACRIACDNYNVTCKAWEFSSGTCSQSVCSNVQLASGTGRTTYSKRI